MNPVLVRESLFSSTGWLHKWWTKCIFHNWSCVLMSRTSTNSNSRHCKNSQGAAMLSYTFLFFLILEKSYFWRYGQIIPPLVEIACWLAKVLACRCETLARVLKVLCQHSCLGVFNVDFHGKIHELEQLVGWMLMFAFAMCGCCYI